MHLVSLLCYNQPHMRVSFLLLIYSLVVILVPDVRIRKNVEKKLAAIIEGRRGKRA